MLDNIEIRKVKITTIFVARVNDNDEINEISIRFKNKEAQEIEVIYAKGCRKTFRDFKIPQKYKCYIRYAINYLGY